jgi:hypothetical protein
VPSWKKNRHPCFRFKLTKLCGKSGKGSQASAGEIAAKSTDDLLGGVLFLTSKAKGYSPVFTHLKPGVGLLGKHRQPMRA